MSLDFQRMRTESSHALRYAGEKSISDHTSHQKGGIGCAARVHGAWVGGEKCTVGVEPLLGLGYTGDPRCSTPARTSFSRQLDHHALVPAEVSEEASRQVQGF